MLFFDGSTASVGDGERGERWWEVVGGGGGRTLTANPSAGALHLVLAAGGEREREGGERLRGGRARVAAAHLPLPSSSLQDIAFLKVDPAAIPYPDAVAPLASWTTFPVDRAVADGDFAPVLAVGSPGSYPFA